MAKIIILGITGASGSIYAQNFIRHAAAMGIDLRIVPTEMGSAVFSHETGETITDAVQKLKSVSASAGGSIRIYKNSDMFADIASGSYRTDGMVVIPCSMKTLSGIASGYSSSLLERAADVALKEKRKLVLGTRETPLSLIHLKNMTGVSEAGGVILPASPGFYHKPESIDGLADFMTGKIFDLFGIDHNLNTSWK